MEIVFQALFNNYFKKVNMWELKNLGNGIWKVHYRNVFLGFYNENQLRSKEASTSLETNFV